MKNKILILFSFYVITNLCSAQIINAYGGYIQSRCQSCFQLSGIFYYELEVNVFFNKKSNIPDTLFLSSGLNVTYLGLKKEETLICDNLVGVKYIIPSILYGNGGIYTLVAQFEKNKVKFINDTLDFYLATTIQMGALDFGFENISTTFKNNPMVEIEKGHASTINLTKDNEDGDSITFSNLNTIFNYPNQNFKNAKLNNFTGDLYFPNNLDTGWYFFKYNANDYLRKYRTLHSTSRNFFVLHVINEKLPYFNHFNNAKIDETGIHNVYASPTAQVVNYQADFINPKGLGNYSVNITPTKPLNKPTTITINPINDTLVHINIDIHLDTGYYKVYKDLPTSLSIIITTTDSIGNCKQDLTSFYVTNNEKNILNEIIVLNKLRIFPNPANNKLSIDLGHKIINNLKVMLYDNKGSLVKNLIITKDADLEIDVSNLSQGLYFVEVLNEHNRFITKFVKE